MNDHDAMEEINIALDKWFKDEISQEDALKRICYVSGANSMDHNEAKQAQQ